MNFFVRNNTPGSASGGVRKADKPSARVSAIAAAHAMDSALGAFGGSRTTEAEFQTRLEKADTYKPAYEPDEVGVYADAKTVPAESPSDLAERMRQSFEAEAQKLLVEIAKIISQPGPKLVAVDLDPGEPVEVVAKPNTPASAIKKSSGIGDGIDISKRHLVRTLVRT